MRGSPLFFGQYIKGPQITQILLILMSVICGQVIIFFKEFYMKKTRFALETLIIGMAFSLVLAGCATTVGTEDPTAAAQAEQLAADLNAIKAGCATVNAATVTLTGGIGLTDTGLTVSKGVTLDLTADGAALELQDGAVLTVNGTVNATGHGDHGKGWVDGSLRIGNGAAVINGSGTINLKSKGRLLNIWGGDGKRHLTLDGVTLAGLEDNDASLVEVSEGGELIMKSGAITGNTRTGDDWASGGGVNVHKGTFTMEGGTITGNRAVGTRGANGGGVQVGEESVFTITGGTITGNTAEGGENTYGGGAYVDKGTFTMEGGAITGNSVQSSQKNASGGGISINDGGMFTLSGGTISGNSVQGERAARGGGVYLNSTAMFIMSGGTISDNRAKQGGGVLQGNDSTFTMKGGTISGNTATESGGGVKLMWMDNEAPVTFIMEGGTIYGRAAEGGNANTAPTSNNDAALSAGSRTAKWGTGGTYTKGGASQTGGSDIGGADDTLIAVPAQ
jgi:hypothetical protein